MNKILLTIEEQNEYAEKHMNLVYHVAKSFLVSDTLREELHGSGFVGLTKALKTFDKAQNTAKFSTYACKCISNEMCQFLRKENKKARHELQSIEHSFYDSESGGTFESEYYHDRLFVTEDYTLDDMIIKEEFNEVMETVATFAPKKQKVVKLRFGIDCERNFTQTEIAGKTNSTQASVCKIEKACVSILRDIHRIEIKA